MRFAFLVVFLAFAASATGCGLLIDTAPPDPVPDSGSTPGCTEDEQCKDGDVCDGLESCVEGACVVTGRLDCDDHVACTVDSCDSSLAACIHTPDASSCGSGSICNPSADPGTSPSGCVTPKSCGGDPECDDSDPCTGHESCVDGLCVLGRPVVCRGEGCLAGRCTSTGDCEMIPNVKFCSDDAIGCTADECDAKGFCHYPPADAACEDGFSCTVDKCSAKVVANDTTGCTHRPVDTNCESFVAPTCAARVCAPAGAPPGDTSGCALALIPSSCAQGTRCNFASDECEPLPQACDTCDDGNPCNGVEACSTVGAGAVCTTTRDGCGPSIDLVCRVSYCDLSTGKPACGTRASPDDACWELPISTTSTTR